MDFTGFLFGNVNEEGELVDEGVLDKDCVAGLSRLGVGLGSVINEDLVVEEGDSDEGVEESFELAAEDFTDIAEVADEEDCLTSKLQQLDQVKYGESSAPLTFVVPPPQAGVEAEDDDYDDYDTPSMKTEPVTIAQQPPPKISLVPSPVSAQESESQPVIGESCIGLTEDSGFDSQNTPLDEPAQSPGVLTLEEGPTPPVASAGLQPMVSDSDTALAMGALSDTDDCRLAGPLSDTRPAEPLSDTRPAEPLPDTRPAGPLSDTRPAGPLSDTRPAGPLSDTRPAGPLSDTRPAGPLSDTRPTGPLSDTRPAGPLSDTRPAGPLSDTRPAGPLSDTRPTGPLSDTRPAGPLSDTRPAGPLSDTRPAGPLSDTRPAGPLSDTRPAGPLSDTRPAGPLSDTRPAGPLSDTRPAEPLSDTRPAGPLSDTRPTGPLSDTRPAEPLSDTRPTGPLLDTRPTGPLSDTRPTGPLSDTRPVGALSDTRPAPLSDINDRRPAVNDSVSAPESQHPSGVAAGEFTDQIDSAIPALIPENMTLEELRAKVKQLFPGFKPHGILRFSSLLGPGKPSSLPRIWREARKPRKKKKKKPAETCTWTLDLDCEVPPEMVMSDDETQFLCESSESKPSSSATATKINQSSSDPFIKEWRFGPAKVWYDAMGVPEDGRGFDYGFKLKKREEMPQSTEMDEIPEEAFLMVTQEHWEDKVVDIPVAPSPQFSGVGGAWGRSNVDGTATEDTGLQTSLFPIDNYDLIYRRWEDDVIFPDNSVVNMPQPILPQIDPNDPNFIIGIPVEPPPVVSGDKDGRKESKKLTRQGGGRGKAVSDSPQLPCFHGKKDPFNVSNDEYYNPKHVSSGQALLSGLDGMVVQHSTPALNLYPAWFPTQLSSNALRHFHRPKLRIRCPRGENSTGWYSVTGLESYLKLKAEEREKERTLSGGGEVFFMRAPVDLSSCDGNLVLAEYSEQYPPLMSATGLATKIKNYYRRSERQVKSHTPDLLYGETTYVQNTSYFLGQLSHGQVLQSFENNLFRAPIYQHQMSENDFVLVIVGNEVYIRDPPHVFVVGQLCPKVEVPAPNSKPATQFQKELLQVFLYRQFRESKDNPKRLKMDVIRKAFPANVMSESVIRKVLKTCADFKREGYENGWWVLRQDFRLPNDEELRSQITPEQVCAYHSMLAAEHRLKEAGYRGKSLFTVEEEEDEDSANKMDDEVRAAPWNTTHHFINASKGKYQLSTSGPADPTGCGEGFSYTRLNPKRDNAANLAAQKKYKNVMGTDGDLRKLKLSKAKSLLRNFGVSEDEIAKLSRWQVIDRVRELSTEAARTGDGGDLMNFKFARGARFSQLEAQERYKDDCQKMFDLQNSVLSSAEVLSTDEESSGAEDDSDNELGRNLETLLRGKKTTAQLSYEQEEAERVELQRLLSEERPSRTPDLADTGTPVGLAADVDDTSSIRSSSSMVGRHLIISRTFHDEEGRKFVRDELVKRPDVIQAYVQLSSEVRSKFVDQDEETREDMKKEKKKLQDQLRRLIKTEEKEKKKAEKPQKPKPLTTIKMKCSACGQTGHMKTNRKCPQYKNNPVNVAPTDLDLARAETELSQDDLVKVEGTKVVLNKAVVEHVKDVRRKSLVLKFPNMRKKRRGPTDEDLEYLESRKSVQRRKTNPEVPFADHLEKVLQTLIILPESFHFRKPVNSKLVPDYYNVIKFPMDLQSMRDHCRRQVYKSREQFREHINLIVTNCITYNGMSSDVTKHARLVAEVCEQELAKIETELEQLEAEINPALDDNALVAFSYVLSKVVDTMKQVPESWPFHSPVSSKKIPDYHKIIKSPMDLQTMKKKCSSHQYLNRDSFMADLNQILENSITYNGPSSPYTQTAQLMKAQGIQKLQEDSKVLEQLEKRVSGTASPSPLLKLLEGSQPLADVLEDLQHSSSSSSSGSDSEMEVG